MAVYLVEHPPRTQQFRCPRRERPSGVVGVHTAESFPDDDPPDTGAENVARFIANRASYGSYHWLADSDSYLQLIEHNCVAYHIATHGLNEHTIGISAATQAHRWDDLPGWWVDATLRNMARAAADAAKWLKREHGITVPARRITLSQALNREPGFLAHADADPDRRRDPGRSFPWSTFLDYYAAEMGDAVSYEDVWRTDDKMRGPKDLAPDDNKRWWPESVLEHVADEVLARVFRSPYLREKIRQGKEASTRWLQEWTWHYSKGARAAAREARDAAKANGRQLAELRGEMAGLADAVAQLAGGGVDMARVQAAAQAGAAEALRDVEVTVTFDGDEPDDETEDGAGGGT